MLHRAQSEPTSYTAGSIIKFHRQRNCSPPQAGGRGRPHPSLSAHRLRNPLQFIEHSDGYIPRCLASPLQPRVPQQHLHPAAQVVFAMAAEDKTSLWTHPLESDGRLRAYIGACSWAPPPPPPACMVPRRPQGDSSAFRAFSASTLPGPITQGGTERTMRCGPTCRRSRAC